MFFKKKLKKKKLEEESYSNLGEQQVIQRLLEELGIETGYCVDIAASDGVTMSNTLALYAKGWGGLAVEYNPIKFALLSKGYKKFESVNLAKCKVIPANVLALLEANQAPKEFEFLNLDIDSYDHYVLKAMLSTYRPALICAEVNEKIPPPLKFSVKWDEGFYWREDHFYGQSLSMLYDLVKEFDYSLVELHYNNAFLIPAEKSPLPALTPEQAYQDGYLNQPDRKEKFPWNADMEALIGMDHSDAIEFVREKFRAYEGQYVLS